MKTWRPNLLFRNTQESEEVLSGKRCRTTTVCAASYKCNRPCHAYITSQCLPLSAESRIEYASFVRTQLPLLMVIWKRLCKNYRNSCVERLSI